MKIKTSHLFLLIVVVLLVLIVLLLKNISNITINNARVDFPGTQRESMKQNCDVETIYSVEDSQCEAICREPGVFRTKNGTCVNILAFSQEAVDNTCDPEKGVMAYLLGDPQLGRTKLLCLSVDLGVQPDNVVDPNTLCTDGSIEINYIKSFPQLNSCKCSDDKILALTSNTSTIRQRGTCVNKSLYNIYKFNNLLYDKNSI